MIHRFVGRLGIIDMDTWDTKLGAELATVHNRRASAVGQTHKVRRFFRQAMAEKDQTVRLSLLEHRCIAFFTVDVVLCVPNKHRITLPLRRVFDALKDERKERIRKIRHRYEKLAGPERS